MDFTPWKMDHVPGQPGPSGKVMNRLGVAARMAAAVVERSKSELISLWRNTAAGDEAVFEMMDSFGEAAEIMKSLAAMAETAQMRLLVAAHAYAAESGGDVWAEVEGNAADQNVPVQS
jgi:hypothetical protein